MHALIHLHLVAGVSVAFDPFSHAQRLLLGGVVDPSPSSHVHHAKCRMALQVPSLAKIYSKSNIN